MSTHPGRTLLTMIGVGLGVAATIAVQTANMDVLRSFEDSVLAVAGPVTLEVSAGETGMEERLIASVRGIAGVNSAKPVGEFGVRLAGRIVFPLTGINGGPNSITIQISGYGADRHISIAPAPTFPDTFKNPGDQAPVMPVTITNNGDAPLDVSAVMLTNDPVWTVVNPDPVSIAGRASHDFNVRFSPLTAGKAPVGHMVLVNNDNGLPMAAVDLNGNGLDRNVAFGPPIIDLGYVGIGHSIRLSEVSPAAFEYTEASSGRLLAAALDELAAQFLARRDSLGGSIRLRLARQLADRIAASGGNPAPEDAERYLAELVADPHPPR